MQFKDNRGGTAIGPTRSGNVFPEVDEEEKLEIVLHDTGKMTRRMK